MKRFVDDEDLRLIRAAKRGDPEAFTLLVTRYKNYVYKAAFGTTGNQMDAEDVTQEVFIRAYRSLAQLQEERAFPSWLLTITTRLALDVARKRTRELSLVEGSDQTGFAHPGDQMETAIQRMLLQNLLTRLNPEARTVLILREIHQCSYQEIADILAIPIGTVRSRLHAARLQLRDMIQEGEKETSNHDL